MQLSWFVYSKTLYINQNFSADVFIFSVKMCIITEELIHKKMGHNEGEISSLKKLSLERESIEKIEHFQDWCTHLEIVLLQGNLIAQIENLNTLKRMHHLNLAENNIEIVDNLERCLVLQKLDLSLNFIGNIESVCTLGNNKQLNELNLFGNPCTKFKGYRDYLIYKLPQLNRLDGAEITRSERLKAAQTIDIVESQVRDEQGKYMKSRCEQRVRLAGIYPSKLPMFWTRESEYCPEIRLEMARQQRLDIFEKQAALNESISLYGIDGQPLYINQAKLRFNFICDTNVLKLQIELYKHLDSTLLQVDLHPTYVTVRIKKLIFQLLLSEEINIENSFARRCEATGLLTIQMPKINQTFPAKTDNQKLSPLECKKREYLKIVSDELPEPFNVKTQKSDNQANHLDNNELHTLQ